MAGSGLPPLAVAHRGVTRRLRAPGISALRAQVAVEFGLSHPPALEFETRAGERARLDSDAALAIAAAAAPAAGHIQVADPELPPAGASVAQCAHILFAAVVDTAARSDVAAALVALSRRGQRASPPGSPMQVSPPPSRPTTPPPINGARGSLSPRGRLSPCQSVSPRASSPQPAPLPTSASVVTTPEAQFCVHNGVSCSGCHCTPITGARYRCTQCRTLNLCEACRRSGAYDSDGHSFVVFDHPWEASDEYAGVPDGYRAPPAPLGLGDVGPRVVHLHFVLYTLGYLFLLKPGFCVDRFTTATRDALASFQDECASDGPRGAYSARTRGAVLSRFDDIEAAPPTCRAEAAGSSLPRLRSVLAA